MGLSARCRKALSARCRTGCPRAAPEVLQLPLQQPAFGETPASTGRGLTCRRSSRDTVSHRIRRTIQPEFTFCIAIGFEGLGASSCSRDPLLLHAITYENQEDVYGFTQDLVSYEGRHGTLLGQHERREERRERRSTERYRSPHMGLRQLLGGADHDRQST